MNNERLLIARFRKESEGVRINAWINLFELVNVDQPNDAAKVRMLMRYVEGEALTWFGDEIAPQAATISWDDVRRRMIARFGQITVRPLLAAHKRVLKSEENVQKYYEEKMDLIRQTTMTVEDTVASLTEGMPYQYHNHLIASGAVSPSEWLSKALQLESSIGKKRAPFRPIPEAATASTNRKPPGKDQKKGTTAFQTKPRVPCRFCKAQGRELYHWHSDCHLNPNAKPRPTGPPVIHHNLPPTTEATAAAAQALANQGN